MCITKHQSSVYSHLIELLDHEGILVYLQRNYSSLSIFKFSSRLLPIRFAFIIQYNIKAIKICVVGSPVLALMSQSTSRYLIDLFPLLAAIQVSHVDVQIDATKYILLAFVSGLKWNNLTWGHGLTLARTDKTPLR